MGLKEAIIALSSATSASRAKILACSEEGTTAADRRLAAFPGESQFPEGKLPEDEAPKLENIPPEDKPAFPEDSTPEDKARGPEHRFPENKLVEDKAKDTPRRATPLEARELAPEDPGTKGGRTRRQLLSGEPGSRIPEIGTLQGIL